MRVLWSVQILASFGFEIYNKNWKIQKTVVAMETVRKISNFFYISVHHSIYVKNVQSFRKVCFSISKPYKKVSDFPRE